MAITEIAVAPTRLLQPSLQRRRFGGLPGRAGMGRVLGYDVYIAWPGRVGN